MRIRLFINKLMMAIGLSFLVTVAHAGMPVWTVTPLTPTAITVPANGTATVSYRVTNQSRRTHTLVMNNIPGIQQITTSGNCPAFFTLGYQQSCTLNLFIDGSLLTGDVIGGPIVCNRDNPNQCYQPGVANNLRITKSSVVNYTVGGSVFGLLGTLVLANNGGDDLTINADGIFVFSNALPPGSPYLVTVQSQPPTQTCSVTNGSGTINNMNVTDVIVNCSTNTRTVGGNVTGLAISESVVLQNNGGDNLTLNSNGSFTFSTPVAQGATYNVTVLTQPSTQTCTVTNGNGTVGAINITDVQVTCNTNAYTVGGTISGLSGTVTLQNNGADNLLLNSNGSFTFAIPVAQGATYNVTVLTQPSGQTCVVTNGSGTMGGINVTNVGVACAASATTLSASVSQLALSVTGLTEYGVTGTPSSGLARVITITNTGSNPTSNLVVTPPTWPTGTTSGTTCGSTLGASNSCTITVTPGATATSDGTDPCSVGTAPVPGTIQVAASNSNTVSINVVVLDYGCVYQGGYVYAFDDTTANTSSVAGKALTTSNQATSNIVWASNGGVGSSSLNGSYDTLPGIAETSTSTTGAPTYSTFATFFSTNYNNPNPFTSGSFAQCDGALNGSCNTANILTFYNQFITNNTTAAGGTPPYTATSGPTNTTYYAAGLCKQTIATFSDWYLPALCEMGYGNGSTPCGLQGSPTLQNVQSSLLDGATPPSGVPSGGYWSSTERASSPSNMSMTNSYSGPFGGAQGFSAKASLRSVRCSRAF